jgi:MOSC domain-containing protein YiiM
MARLISVNVGRPRTFELKDKTHSSSIWKSPVSGRVAVRGVNVDGDEQADLKVHGGPDKAVYSYAEEDYRWWSNQLGEKIGPGTFGDNLTTSGIDLNGALIGERWRVGTTVLEVAQPRLPCFKLGVRMEDPGFPRKFSDARRWGAYLRIIEDGEVGAGDTVEVFERPDHHVTVDLIASTYYGEHSRAREILAAPQLPNGWREWAQDIVSRSAEHSPDPELES